MVMSFPSIYGRCLAISYATDDNMPQIIRYGKVSSVNKKDCSARVIFEDHDDNVSPELRVIVRNTMNKKDYWLPDVDEMVVCLFMPNGEETGFILGSVYSEVDKPVPEISEQEKDRTGLWIDSGNFIKWEEETRQFVVRSEKPVRWEGG